MAKHVHPSPGFRPAGSAFLETLHIMRFTELAAGEFAMLQKIARLAMQPPKPMKIVSTPTLWGSCQLLQAAISDYAMKGTIVISHGSPGGKIWEDVKKAKTICPSGFHGDLRYPCTHTLAKRPSNAARPEWVLLAGCHLGAAVQMWNVTFGEPLMLDASEVYVSGGPSEIQGNDNDTESTIPKLQAVLDWLKQRKWG